MAFNAIYNRWPGSGSSLLLGCLLCFAFIPSRAQNLVPNPSFELRDSCLEVNTAYTEETGPLGWFSAGGTGDYFMSCIPYGGFNGVPLSSWAFQYPQEGEAFVGVITYDWAQGYREYFMVELSEPLTIGHTYYVSMYASPTWGGPQPQMWLATSHVGMLFTTQPRTWQSGQSWPTGSNAAHVYHPWIIADTMDWTLVSGSVIADSAYRYVMIGNHFNNANTDTLHLDYYPWNPLAHTLIDNVCVSVNPDGCPLSLGVSGSGLEAAVLYPNPARVALGLSGVPSNTRVVIRDALGRLLWLQDGVDGAWQQDIRVWARGSYVLRLEWQGRSRTFKFVLIE